MSLDTLNVHTLCAYLTSTDSKWRQEDYTASKAVKALKGDEIKGYFELRINDKNMRFDNSNASDFAEIVPAILAKFIKRQYPGPVTLVPIPNSKVVTGAEESFKTKRMAEEIAKKAGSDYQVVPALVFVKEQPKSRSEGGSRSPTHIESQYRLVKPVVGSIILVDDVCTTGAHFVAAAWKLAGDKRTVLGAVAFGGATKSAPEKVFGPKLEEFSLSRQSIDLSWMV